MGGGNKERNAELTSEGIITISLCMATPEGISVRIPMLFFVYTVAVIRHVRCTRESKAAYDVQPQPYIHYYSLIGFFFLVCSFRKKKCE